MISYEEFKRELKKNINDFYKEDVEFLEEKKVYKPNREYEGLCIKFKNIQLAPVIDLQDWYDTYRMGAAIPSILKKFNNALIEHANDLNVNVNKINKSYILEHVTLAAINMNKGQGLLNNVYYQRMADIAFIPKIYFDDTHSSTITKKICKEFNISEDELMKTAIHNMENQSYMFKPMRDYFKDIDYEYEEVEANKLTDAYILSTNNLVNGAGLIVSDKIADRISREVDGDFYIIPSSRNELLILPETLVNKDMFDMIKETIEFVNEVEVDSSDYLSDNFYHYDITTHQLEIVNKDLFYNEDKDGYDYE